MSRFQRQFEDVYRSTRECPFAFAAAMNYHPTWQQRQGLDLLARYAVCPSEAAKIAIKSGQGPGKTTFSVICGLWQLWRKYNSLGIVTAPTMRQGKDIWMVEAKLRLDAADPQIAKFFKLQKTKITLFGVDTWNIQVTTATTSEKAQGFHRPGMFVIMEEASGISEAIVTQYKGTMTNPSAFVLMIGNPNTRDCEFYKPFTSQRHKWKTLTWNAEETPESEWFSKTRNQDLADEFGRDSDVYRIRVLGEFPYADPNCVMSTEDLEPCTDPSTIIACSRLLRATEHGGGMARQMGMDFARFGGDENTLYRRSGNAIVEWAREAHMEPARMVERAFKWQKDAGWKDEETLYVADAGGMGQGVMHLFYDAGKRIVEFHTQGVPSQYDYENIMTEGWFHLAKLVKKRRAYLPKDDTLLTQLSTRQYFTNKKGKLVLESKDDYMRRGHDSPDRADGCVQAFYDGMTAGGRSTTKGNTKTVGYT